MYSITLREGNLYLRGDERVRLKKKKSVSELLGSICRALLNKKAEGLRVINVSNLIGITDFFVICSAESTTQVSAITDELLRTADRNGFKITGVEGTENNLWVLVDFGDVVVHIFHEPVRLFYDLDGLWRDAEEISINDLLTSGSRTLTKKL